MYKHKIFQVRYNSLNIKIRINFYLKIEFNLNLYKFMILINFTNPFFYKLYIYS
jgi:hypothetical protein